MEIVTLWLKYLVMLLAIVVVEQNTKNAAHPSFFGLHFSLALVPDRDPLRHIALPLDRYRNRDRYRVSFHFISITIAIPISISISMARRRKSVNYFRGTMKDAKCCLRKDEEKSIESEKSVDISKNTKASELPGGQFVSGIFVEDDLDLLSNSVVDLINEGKFEQAEEKCIELLKNYPDVVDGFDRFAMLFEARGENQKAVEYYRKAADFMKERPGYDPSSVANALNKVEQLS